jgi:hypothetical protein
MFSVPATAHRNLRGSGWVFFQVGTGSIWQATALSSKMALNMRGRMRGGMWLAPFMFLYADADLQVLKHISGMQSGKSIKIHLRLSSDRF